MPWWKFREGPLRTYGGFLLLGTIAALLLFYLGRGRIPVDGGMAGTTITRFKAFERFAHWLLAGSFILLGVTGLLSLFGRAILQPYFGKELNDTGYMRFNAFRDEIEMADTPSQSESDVILIKSADVIPLISGERYEYLPYRPVSYTHLRAHETPEHRGWRGGGG